jgi:OOP family OmpA-OmpF porin
LRNGTYDKYGVFAVTLNYNILGTNANAQNIEWTNPFDNKIINEKLVSQTDLAADADGDGVADLLDKEPNTPAGCKVDGAGRAIDTDGDGVVDCRDRERLSPAGYPVDQYGVAQIPDSDGDGVADSKDADPYTAKGAKVDANGQELDTDGDGVADSKDLEPATESGSLVNFQGLTIAKPGQHGKDGVSGSNGSNGSGSGYMPSIFFDLGSATVKSVYNDRIFVIAKMMKTNPSVKITITGNCDVTGSDNENQRLGARRAENVKDILVKNFGIDSSRISAETNGSKDPITVKLNSMNRRVDFSVK